MRLKNPFKTLFLGIYHSRTWQSIISFRSHRISSASCLFCPWMYQEGMMVSLKFISKGQASLSTLMSMTKRYSKRNLPTTFEDLASFCK